MRTLAYVNFKTRTARESIKLKQRSGAVFRWEEIRPHVQLGYRKRRAKAGDWWLRVYEHGKYRTERLALADDGDLVADGDKVLNYDQAKEWVLKRSGDGAVTISKGTVGDAVALYIADMKTKDKPSVRGVEQRARLHIIPQLGSTVASKLRTADIVAWLNALAESPALYRAKVGGETERKVRSADDEEARRKRRASANKVLTILKSALNHSFRLGKISSDTEWRRVEAFEGVDAARPGYLLLDEAKRLVNASEPTSGFRNLVRAALETGCRYGELCRLKVGDFEHGEMIIRKSKTGRPRNVILSPDGVAFFAELVKGRKSSETLLLRSSKDYFGNVTVREWRKSEQDRPMVAACKAARLPNINFHALRHTWASLSVMNGLPLLVVSHNLGHTDTRMVEKHYGHLSKSHKHEAVENYAPRFGKVARSNVRVLAQ
jgi:integrase